MARMKLPCASAISHPCGRATSTRPSHSRRAVSNSPLAISMNFASVLTSDSAPRGGVTASSTGAQQPRAHLARGASAANEPPRRRDLPQPVALGRPVRAHTFETPPRRCPPRASSSTPSPARAGHAGPRRRPARRSPRRASSMASSKWPASPSARLPDKAIRTRCSAGVGELDRLGRRSRAPGRTCAASSSPSSQCRSATSSRPSGGSTSARRRNTAALSGAPRTCARPPRRAAWSPSAGRRPARRGAGAVRRSPRRPARRPAPRRRAGAAASARPSGRPR